MMRNEVDTLLLIEQLRAARSERSEEFQNIVDLAAGVFAAPIAAITVLDQDTQWFFAARGTSAESGARCEAFCDVTVKGETPFIVEDARREPAFKANPLVTQAPHLRFYAGAPICMGPGLRLGALIVIDPVPRRADPERVRQLERLAAVAARAFMRRGELEHAKQRAKELAGQRSLIAEQNRLLHETQEVFEVASELAHFGSWSLDLETQSLTWSRGTKRIHGAPEDFQPSLQNAIGFYAEEARPLIEEKVTAAIENGVEYRVDLPITTLTGEQRWVSSIGRVETGGDGAPKRIFGCAIDVTEHHNHQQAIERLATTDALTGLMNRRAVEALFVEKRAASPRRDAHQHLLMLDLDDFKMINDGEGHDVGDLVLKCVANLLRQCAQPTGFVARLGGDEFLMLIDAASGLALAQQVLDALRCDPYLNTRATPLTASIGMLDLGEEALEFKEALKRADTALYEAKKGGRNRVAVYQPSHGAAFLQRRSELAGMAAALEDGRIVPAYQLQRRLSDGRICGFEALARVQDPPHGLLTPARFQAAFEDPATAAKISNAMLDKVAADAAELRQSGFDFGRLSLNMAELQLLDDTFEERLEDLIFRHDLRYTDFMLELTETILLSRQFDRLKERLTALQDRGTTVAFDDFGTGYASLTHLRMLKIDQLKIDRSFVSSMNTDPSCRTIAKSIIQMARNLGVETVAEGVETSDIAATLREFKCDVAQGYHYSKPVLFDTVRQQLAAESRSFAPAC